jgi:hypothetical protein
MGILFKILDQLAEGLLNILVTKPAPKKASSRKASETGASNREGVFQDKQNSHERTSVRKTEAPIVSKRQAAFRPVRNTYTTESGLEFTPLWQKLGWKVNAGNKYQFIGHYRFYDKRKKEDFGWEGAIQTGPYEFKVFIRNPPNALKQHHHWQCFNYTGNGWFSVHFINPLDGLDDAILNVQRLITEAHLFY